MAYVFCQSKMFCISGEKRRDARQYDDKTRNFCNNQANTQENFRCNERTAGTEPDNLYFFHERILS